MSSTVDCRLRKPEIQSSVFHVSEPAFESGHFSSTHINPPPITLTERFTRITTSGTSVYNKRFPGRFLDAHLPHLIITNNPRLPPATLVRQAKSISVVVERKFPPGKRPMLDEDPNDTAILIPRRPAEGCKPVFDRPEIKFYKSFSDEGQIAKRLLERVSPKSKQSEFGRSSNTRHQDRLNFTHPGRFFGCRVDDFSGGSRSGLSLNPLETPRNPAYFLHDTRDDNDLTSRRNWRTRFPNVAGYRRDFRDRRSPGSPDRNLSERHDSPGRFYGDLDSGRWQHDKFEQLEREGDHAVDMPKTAPKPVPAPKPILWSTIGKEIVNGESKDIQQNPRRTYTPIRSPPHRDDENLSGNASKASLARGAYEAEDVRIDMEPVLVETMDES